MIVLAREASGFTQGELASKVGLTQAHLSRIEAGLTSPTRATLEALSRSLGRPVEFFSLEDELYGFDTSLLFHRKKRALSLKFLKRLHGQVNVRRLQLSRLLQGAEFETDFSFPFVDVHEHRGGPSAIANELRAAWQLPLGPVENLTATIEAAGGLLLKWSCGSRQFDGISQVVPGMPPLFVLNSDAPADRARFSLAHELGHVVMHRVPSENIEVEANQFASEFLMPRTDILPELRDLSLPRLAELKSYWRVSMQALIMRATQLKAISASQAKRLWMDMGIAGYRMEEPAETAVAEEHPTLVRRLVDYYREELGYSDGELAALLHTTPEDVRNFFLRRTSLSIV